MAKSEAKGSQRVLVYILLVDKTWKKVNPFCRLLSSSANEKSGCSARDFLTLATINNAHFLQFHAHSYYYYFLSICIFFWDGSAAVVEMNKKKPIKISATAIARKDH